MSDIHYDMGTNFAIYGIILQKTIDDVLKRLGISDNGIKWIIFEEEKYQKQSMIPSFALYRNYRYGFCRISAKEIWISTSAIMKAPYYGWSDIMQISGISKKKDNFLANVIMDELSHIITKKDHGNKIYDDKLSYFRSIYYNDCLFATFAGNENILTGKNPYNYFKLTRT